MADRKFQNFISGTLALAVSATDTTLTSTGLAALLALSNPSYVLVTLNPEGDTTYSPAPEVVQVASHVGAATSATVLRGQQGTVAQIHAVNTPWVAAVVAADFQRLDTLDGQMTAVTADGWVTGPRLLDGAVGPNKINQSALEPDKGLALTSGRLATVADGITVEQSTAGLRVKAASIGTTSLTDGSVTPAKLGAGSVTSPKMGLTEVYATVAAQAMGSSGNVQLVTSDVTDGAGIHNAGVVTITPTTAGLWAIWLDVDYTVPALGTVTNCRAEIRINATIAAETEPNTGGTHRFNLTLARPLVDGDTVTMFVRRDDTNASQTATAHLTMLRMR